mmetsp:Transcript_54182/g.141661  ORF Transcript_54182/g.141661 Transcript_54182/m.141661 type:complete len:288 (+) Transcript_54182:656-1519(+)
MQPCRRRILDLAQPCFCPILGIAQLRLCCHLVLLKRGLPSSLRLRRGSLPPPRSCGTRGLREPPLEDRLEPGDLRLADPAPQGGVRPPHRSRPKGAALTAAQGVRPHAPGRRASVLASLNVGAVENAAESADRPASASPEVRPAHCKPAPSPESGRQAPQKVALRPAGEPAAQQRSEAAAEGFALREGEVPLARRECPVGEGLVALLREEAEVLEDAVLLAKREVPVGAALVPVSHDSSDRNLRTPIAKSDRDLCASVPLHSPLCNAFPLGPKPRFACIQAPFAKCQ